MIEKAKETAREVVELISELKILKDELASVIENMKKLEEDYKSGGISKKVFDNLYSKLRNEASGIFDAIEGKYSTIKVKVQEIVKEIEEDLNALTSMASTSASAPAPSTTQTPEPSEVTKAQKET